MTIRKIASYLGLAFAVGCGAQNVGSQTEQIVAGAGFTTFDSQIGGCLDGPNGIDCNNYVAKADVFMSGGPNAAGLSDGSYYFAVLVPGYQRTGFVDGADGNLSDVTAGATDGDTGAGDDVSNRTFTVANHEVTGYAGTHAIGTSPNGRNIIGLYPYDDTANDGGVYILAICQTGATSPSQCKYDAFRVQKDQTVQIVYPVISGAKYYDANANGVWDNGEPGIPGWPINYTDQVAGTVFTDASGNFSLTMIADTYTFWESLPTAPLSKFTNGSTVTSWMQTGNTQSQAVATGGAQVVLNADKTYSMTVVDGSTVSGVYFGNLCIGGGGGGLTLGFWSNKNGQAVITSSDYPMLDALNLRTANGGNFDPTNYSSLRNWLLNATATNMAYMLSAQLATMELNVAHNDVKAGALIYAPGTQSANAAGFATVGAIMTEANAALGANGYTVAADATRSYQEALKNALDNANNNLNFVQASPATCPAPVF